LAKPQKKRRKEHERKPSRETLAAESRPAEAATVAWMLATMATLAAEVIALLTLAILALGDEPAKAPLVARLVPGIMLTIAVLTGLAGLALNVATGRLRKTSPPRIVTVAATLINLSPLVAIGLLWLAQAMNRW
jgi:hypothetical protein